MFIDFLLPFAMSGIILFIAMLIMWLAGIDFAVNRKIAFWMGLVFSMATGMTSWLPMIIIGENIVVRDEAVRRHLEAGIIYNVVTDGIWERSSANGDGKNVYYVYLTWLEQNRRRCALFEMKQRPPNVFVADKNGAPISLPVETKNNE